MKGISVRRGKKRMSQLQGKLRQKVKNGPYYYRLMVANGVRREFALKIWINLFSRSILGSFF